MKLIFTSCLFLFLFSANFSFAQKYERYKALTDTSISSKYLGFNKDISITVPKEWQADLNRDFPLIIIFDRQNQRSHNYILNTIDYFTSNEQMPSSVIVSIASEQKYRYVETLHKASSKDGLATENEKFLFEELIPLLEKNYKASSFRLFIGHSRYGYFTSALLNSRINELNAVISLSPFFTQKNVNLCDSIAALRNKKLKANKYYYFGIGNDYPSDFIKMDSVTKNLHNPLLHTKGYFFKTADHNATPGLTIAPALYNVFEDWSAIQAKYISNNQTDLNILSSLEKEIISAYGNKLELSLGTLNGKGWFFYNEGKFEKAIEAWLLLLKTYPNFSETYLYIIDAQIQLKKDYSQTEIAFKNSLSNSKMYTAKEKVDLLAELNSLKKE